MKKFYLFQINLLIDLCRENLLHILIYPTMWKEENHFH